VIFLGGFGFFTPSIIHNSLKLFLFRRPPDKSETDFNGSLIPALIPLFHFGIEMHGYPRWRAAMPMRGLNSSQLVSTGRYNCNI
jgi:hypothetical protein